MWETVLLVPYWIVGVPLTLVADGIGETIEFMDEQGVASTVATWLGPRKGPFGALISARAGGLSGHGAGLAIEHTSLFGRPGTSAKMRGAATSIGDVRLSAGFLVPLTSDNRLELGAGYRFRNRARYFGLGPDRPAGGESFYRQRSWWTGALFEQALGTSWTASGAVLFTSIKPLDARPDEDRPRIADRYADSLPAGFGTTSSGVGLEIELVHRTAFDTGRPQRGGVRQLLGSYFRGTGGGVTEFWTVRADLQQFLPLWYPHNVLALRAMAAWIQPLGDAPVPFTRLLTNDDPDLLRGFDDFRWRDRGLTILSAEYRWPLWAYEHAEGAGLDLYLLADVGQVFSRLSQIRDSRLTFSYGAGVRLVTAAGFMLRLEHARSDETSVWRLRGDQVFQFFRRNLYNGHEPIPAR